MISCFETKSLIELSAIQNYSLAASLLVCTLIYYERKLQAEVYKLHLKQAHVTKRWLRKARYHKYKNIWDMPASSVIEFLKFQLLPLSLKYSTKLLKKENFEVHHNFCDKHKNVQNINKWKKRTTTILTSKVI